MVDSDVRAQGDPGAWTSVLYSSSLQSRSTTPPAICAGSPVSLALPVPLTPWEPRTVSKRDTTDDIARPVGCVLVRITGRCYRYTGTARYGELRPKQRAVRRRNRFRFLSSDADRLLLREAGCGQRAALRAPICLCTRRMPAAMFSPRGRIEV